MYKLSVTDGFSSAHKLNNYDGPCRNLHGHNWKVRLCVTCDELDDIGMAVDFGYIKEKLGQLLNEFDHKLLNELPCFENINPTSENIARVIYEKMSKLLSQYPCQVVETEVWESEKASVIYGL